MSLLASLRRLDATAKKKYSIAGGFVRSRRDDEPVEAHLQYLEQHAGFGVGPLSADVSAVLRRVQALEQEVADLRARVGDGVEKLVR